MMLDEVYVPGDSAEDFALRLEEISGGYPVVIRPETGEVSLLLPTTDDEDAVFYAAYEEHGDPDVAAALAGVLHVRLEDPA